MTWERRYHPHCLQNFLPLFIGREAWLHEHGFWPAVPTALGHLLHKSILRVEIIGILFLEVCGNVLACLCGKTKPLG